LALSSSAQRSRFARIMNDGSITGHVEAILSGALLASWILLIGYMIALFVKGPPPTGSRRLDYRRFPKVVLLALALVACLRKTDLAGGVALVLLLPQHHPAAASTS
jgi:hypothetical protein